jgi:hypothetical protein
MQGTPAGSLGARGRRPGIRRDESRRPRGRQLGSGGWRQGPGVHPGRTRIGGPRRRRAVRRCRPPPPRSAPVRQRGGCAAGVGFAASGTPSRVGWDDGDRPEACARFCRGGALPRPVLFRQGPGRHPGDLRRRRHGQGARDDALPGPPADAGREAVGLLHLPVLRTRRRAVQAHLGDGPGRRRPLAALFAADPPPGAGPDPAEEGRPGDRRAGAAGSAAGARARPSGPADVGPGPGGALVQGASEPGPARPGPARPGPARPGPAGRRGPDQGEGGGPGPGGRGRQAAGGDGQAPALLRARRAGDAGPEPGGHRPGPARAPARGGARAAEAVVAFPRDRGDPDRPGGPGAAGAPGRGPRRADGRGGQRLARGRIAGRGRRGAPLRRRRGPAGRARRAALPDRPVPPPPRRGGGGPADVALGRRPPLAVRPGRAARPRRQALVLARLAPPPRRADGPGRADGPPARPVDPGHRPRRAVRRRRGAPVGRPPAPGEGDRLHRHAAAGHHARQDPGGGPRLAVGACWNTRGWSRSTAAPSPA